MVLERAKEAAGRLKTENPLFDCTFTVENSRRAIEIEEEHEKVRRLKEILGERGLNQESIGINFFTDASILAERDMEQKILLFGRESLTWPTSQRVCGDRGLSDSHRGADGDGGLQVTPLLHIPPPQWYTETFREGLF